MMTRMNSLAALVVMVTLLAAPSHAQVRDARHAAYAQAHITWSIYHETGHAIQDFTGERFDTTKREREQHADKVAAYLMMPDSEDNARWQLFYDAALDLFNDPNPPADTGHGYEASKLRAERMYCMLYGAHPNNPRAGIAQRMKNRSDAECVELFQSFEQEARDVFDFAFEAAEIDEPAFIFPELREPAPRHNDAHAYLERTDILDQVAIDVEQWLPSLQVADRSFQIVARECHGTDGAGYDGFFYKADQSAVVACYAGVQRCMERPSVLEPPQAAYDQSGYLEAISWDGEAEGLGDETDWDDGTGWGADPDWDDDAEWDEE